MMMYSNNKKMVNPGDDVTEHGHTLPHHIET